jgi:hypothetical protein
MTAPRRFFEFACEKILGEPQRAKSGDLHWACPKCDLPTEFHTLPPKEGKKDRCYCNACRYNPDLYDLMRHFHIVRSHAGELAIEKKWEFEYKVRFSGRDSGHWQEVLKKLSPAEIELIGKAVAIAIRENVAIEDIAWPCYHLREFHSVLLKHKKILSKPKKK